MDYCLSVKHHKPLTISPSINPLFLRSNSLFFTYSALPSSSFATSEAGTLARLRHSFNVLINFSSVYFGSAIICHLRHITRLYYICFISYTGYNIWHPR